MERHAATKGRATDAYATKYLHRFTGSAGAAHSASSTRKASHQLRRSNLCHGPLCSAVDSITSVDVHGSSFVSDCRPSSGKPLDKKTLTGMEQWQTSKSLTKSSAERSIEGGREKVFGSGRSSQFKPKRAIVMLDRKAQA